jgi:aryl-alcohol dehydrogenase-like predicted oxidoreductase
MVGQTSTGGKVPRLAPSPGSLAMRHATLGSTALRPSLLAFGCAPMASRVGRTESLRAMSMAYELGVNHFDVARSYGYGEAERVLGEFARGRREKITIATKFGIAVPRVTPARRAAKAVARRLFQWAPRLRQVLRRQLGTQFSANRFSVPDMLASLDQSLTELRTDHVDLLMLHACGDEVLERDDLFLALERLVGEGKVRYCGVATDPDVTERALLRRPRELAVAQFQHSLLDQRAGERLVSFGVGKIAHQPFGGPEGVARLKHGLAALRARTSTSQELRDKLNRLDEPTVADVAINGALHSIGVDVAVCSMFTRNHILANARAVTASRFSIDEISRIRLFFAGERHD